MRKFDHLTASGTDCDCPYKLTNMIRIIVQSKHCFSGQPIRTRVSRDMWRSDWFFVENDKRSVKILRSFRNVECEL